ncbi:MAG: MMPL family transporter [Pseudomonadales bacterium]|nr:MMPL family transporter [Pseudomonadales bacterium]
MNAATQKDYTILLPIILLAGLLVLWITVRSFVVIVSGFVSIIFAQLLTLGFAGLFSFTVNQTSVMAFGLVFILTIADVLHLMSSYLINTKDGMEPHEAMSNSISKNLKPIFLTTVTTMLGFLSMNLSDSPPFAVLGNIAAIGLFCAFCSAVMMIPALIMFFKPAGLKAQVPLLQGFLMDINKFSLDHSRAITITFIVGTSLLALGITENRFHNDPVDYFADTTPIGETTKFAIEKFNSKHSLVLSIDTQIDGGIFENRNIETISQFTQWLYANPSVTSIDSSIELFKTINASLNDNNLKWYTLPNNDQQLSDYYALFQMSTKDASPNVGFINADDSKTLLSINLKPLYNSELIELANSAEKWFEDNAPHLKVSASGTSLTFAEIGLTLITNMMGGALFTIFVITVVMTIAFRSLRIGIFSLLPNIIPAIIAFGIWGLSVGKIDIAAASTFSLSLGIVVDDTIHFLFKYIESRKEGREPREAIEDTFMQVGVALFYTTLILAVGLSIFAFSMFEPNATIAEMMLATATLALVFDFLFLPIALLKVDKWLLKGYLKEPVTKPV